MISAVEFGLVLAAGLASGVHCVGMCGPIVLAYSMPLAKREAWRAHLLYNAGRIATYMVLGAATGSIGSAVGLLGRMAGIASGARIFAGTAMLLAGIAMLAAGGRTSKLVLIRPAGRMIRESRSKLALGLVLGFLPCGLVYAALLKAMDTASAVGGAMTMLAFGLGTAAALLGMGAVSSLAAAPLRRYSTRIAAAATVVFGAVLLYRGIAAGPVCHG